MNDFEPDVIFIDLLGNLILDWEKFDLSFARFKCFISKRLSRGYRIIVAKVMPRPSPPEKYVSRATYKKADNT